MRAWAIDTLVAFDLVMMAYFVAINTLYLVFSIVAYGRLLQYRRRWTPRAMDVILRSPATPAISIIVPAYNEQETIEQSLRSLLLLNYPQFEVVVVNDGSRDGTLDAIVAAFGSMRAPLAYDQPLATKTIRGVFRSLDHPDLVVIDKENGGKADAVNAGINAAQHLLVCVIDADSVLEEHALTRAVLPFLENPLTIAAGGIVRIANGCKVDQGRVVEIAPPRNWLARFQVIEYLRAFLSGRVAMSAANALLIISGAFGLFRRDALVEVGGFRHDTIGEDMEIVARLHRHYREARRPYRISFQPDPVCWTEAPESRRLLSLQRNRWQRGTCQVIGYHARMIANPRYGAIGLFAMPYYVLFEGAGPMIELTGYIITVLACLFGVLDVVFAQLLFLVAVVFGTLISLTSVMLEEISFRRYPRVSHLLLLVACGVLENFGYRQCTTWWRVRGVVDYLRGKRGWGAMTRKGFQHAS